MAVTVRKLRRPLPLLRLLVVAIILFPVLTLGIGGTFLQANNRAAIRRDLQRRTEVAVQNVTRVFETDDVILQEMARMTNGLSDADIAARQQELHLQLTAIAHDLPHIHDLIITGADGNALVRAAEYPVAQARFVTPEEVADATADPNGLLVGGHVVTADGTTRYFDILRARTRPQPGFAGALVVSVRSRILEQQWVALDVANPAMGTAMALVRSDGAVLARAPAIPGVALTASRLRFDGALGHTDSGDVTARSQAEGLMRDFRYQRIGILPVFALGSIVHQSILMAFALAVLPHLWFGIPATILLVGLALLVLRRTMQAEEAMRLAATEQASRIESERLQARAAKLEALGQLAAGVAHDFNNILSAVAGNAELVRRRLLAGRAKEAEALIDVVAEAARRGSELTKGILLFARGTDAPGEAIRPADVIDGMLAFMPPLLGDSISITRTVEDGVWPVPTPRPQLEAALVNLSVNARDAMPGGGTITIVAQNIPASDPRIPAELRQDADWVRIAVLDTGPGFSPAVRARAFEPFMTTKEVGRGTGLGLAQVYRTARQAGGLARIEDRAEGGAVVALYLPRGGSVASIPEPPLMHAEPIPRSLTILLVDHDRLIQVTSAFGLREAGHQIIEADHSVEGLEILSRDDDVDVLVVDYVMPGMNGAMMIAEARKLRPGLPVVIVSGQSGFEDIELPEPTEWLVKPFLPDDLMGAVIAVALKAGAMRR